MQHQRTIVPDWTATVAHCAAMYAPAAVTRCWLDIPGVSVDLHIRLFTEEDQP